MFRTLLVVSTLFFVAACGGPQGDNLAQRYQSKTRELGLFPVYPPREEFQIGDVYYWSRSTSNPNDVETVWVHSMPWLQDQADQFLRTRVVFDASKGNDTTQETDLLAGSLQTRGNQSIKSLPISAFPEITADAGFVAGTGIARVFSALGLSGGNRTTVTLNFNDVRTYWVPNVLVANKVEVELFNVMPAVLPVAEVELTRLLKLRRPGTVSACDNGRACGVSVVTRVYLTREISYTYRSASILAAARTRFVTVDGEAANVTPPAVNITFAGNPAEGDAGVQTQLDALQTQVNALAESGASGESVAFKGWDASGLKFSQTFLRPVAIGWDGFDYQFVESK